MVSFITDSKMLVMFVTVDSKSVARKIFRETKNVINCEGNEKYKGRIKKFW